jgi:polyhydroxyalkanoate synthase
MHAFAATADPPHCLARDRHEPGEPRRMTADTGDNADSDATAETADDQTAADNGTTTHEARAKRATNAPHPASQRRRERPAETLPAHFRHVGTREDADKEAGPRAILPMPMGTEVLDRLVRANMGRLTAHLSPASVQQAFTDWALHLAAAPGKQIELSVKALRKAARLGIYAVESAGNRDTPPCIEPMAHDHRFDDPGWQTWPHNLMYQSFLLYQQWWWNAINGIRGVAPRHEDRAQFAVRQMLDLIAPSNFPLTNPQVLDAAWRSGGANFLHGAQNLIEDTRRRLVGEPPVGAENFRPGHAVAVTPGKVIFRNRLVELIQYAPTTDRAHPEPVFIVPAWIMKYYILDLSPENSLIRWLRDQGHTVYCLSWRNPGPADCDLSMDDYRRMGILAPREAIQMLNPERKIHAVGYCIGGTLLAIEAARMARDGDESFATLTFLATQVDFTEPGELELFIDESEVAYLEDTMWAQGYLDTKQMAGAFQMLRSNDLIWSRMVKEYLMGERQPMFDLMAWNADATRMPYRMHAEYLRRLFLNNDLANGRYEVNSRPVALTDITIPTFVVATEKDHIAPWRSVHKVHLLLDTDITFTLTNGGHNAGIVSEPGHTGRRYRVQTTAHHDPYRDPGTWYAGAAQKEGSWWPEWQRWLARQSGNKVKPPPMGDAEKGLPPLDEAPGTYVFQT